MSIRIARTLVALVVFALLAACGTSADRGGSRTPQDTPVADARAAAAGTAPDDIPPRESEARTIDGYKRDAARRVYFRSTSLLYDGPPPALLKSVVVLSIEVDREGAVKDVRVVRSNGHRELERRAADSVKDASPLPKPRAELLKKSRVGFYETWLFRDDDRFQIRSLAEAQASE